MKLYPIVYTEGARTAKEALSKGVIALHVSSTDTGLKKIVLFDADRAMNAINKAEQFDDALLPLGKRAIVGTVSYKEVKNDLQKVSTSAGVSKFGPLTYQLVMTSIKPAWLKSDDDLTEGEGSSSNVWNKMYSMPEVYERKWLGDWGDDLVRNAFLVNDAGKIVFKNFLKQPTEETVTQHLKKYKKSMADFGHLYAYRLISPEPKIKTMFKSGLAFLDEMEQQGFDQEEIKSLVYDAATVFFERRYAP